MNQSWRWKIIALVGAVLASFYVLVPSFLNILGENHKVESLPSFLPQKGLNLGLDLRGGMYLEMNVDLGEAIKNRVDILLGEIERLATAEKFPGLTLNRDSSNNQVKVKLADERRPEFLELVRENFGDVFEPVIPPADVAPLPGEFEMKVTESYATHLRDMTLKQAEEAVRNRIDRFGVLEASIQRQGDDRILIEIPGVKDPERVIDIVRKTGLLEFKLVDDSIETSKLGDLVKSARESAQIPEGYSKETVEKINAALQGQIPEDDEILFEIDRDPISKQIVRGIPYLVKKRAQVTGDMLRTAQVQITDNQPHVSLSFNKIGTKNFGELTSQNVGKRLAIVLDGVISKAPTIEGAILGGEAQITLGYGNYQTLLQEAEDLSLLLKEGALPASLTVASKTVIGPSLGADSIRKGLYSLLIATVVVAVFMMLYYKWGGVISTVALLLNALFLFAVLALFQASLSLPGIAGIVLTMGMAVDANIIIFERMREEARLGKTAKAVVDSGYGNAMSAIIDSNVTTLFSGIVLYQFGTGPIKGFATTLSLGILTTMVTAVVVTKLIYDYFVNVRKIQKVSI